MKIQNFTQATASEMTFTSHKVTLKFKLQGTSEMSNLLHVSMCIYAYVFAVPSRLIHPPVKWVPGLSRE